MITRIYYCPVNFINNDDNNDLCCYNDWIYYYYDKVIQFNKSFLSYEELLDYVSQTEKLNKNDLFEINFSNNPENLACKLSLGMIEKRAKQIGQEKNFLEWFKNIEPIGFVVFE